MNLENRIWTIDKNESSLLRMYFANIATCHEEIDMIIAKNWDTVKNNKLLSHSIIRRMTAFYRYSEEYSKRNERGLGTEAGIYFEDIIFSPLKALLKEKFGDKFKINRKMSIKLPTKRKNPDLVITDTATNLPVCIIECKTWFDRSNWRQIKPCYNFCREKDYLFVCITGHVGGEKLKAEIENIVFSLTEFGFYEITSEYDVEIDYSVESVFEMILSKCSSL